MKKQILLLTFLSLAFVFAGLNKAYGQVDLDYIDAASTDCVNPTPLTCTTDDELHPLPGVTYTYGVTVTPGVTTGSILWFITDDPNVITAGGLTTDRELNDGSSTYLLSAESGVYDTPTNTQATIDISWQSFDGATNEVLLVAYVEGEDGCSDNVEVYRIEPAFGFTLDIAGLMPEGTLPTTGNANECVSPVQEAVYDGTELAMDYGENYIFFSVNAANFVNSWEPTFSVVNNTTGATVTGAEIEWAYPDQAITSGGSWNSSTTPIAAQDGSGAVGAAGECIVVKVYLDYGNVENATASEFTLGVDGVMYNQPTGDYSNTSLRDLDNPTTGTDCANDVTDEATYELNPRPLIETNTEVGVGDLEFEPKN